MDFYHGNMMDECGFFHKWWSKKQKYDLSRLSEPEWPAHQWILMNKWTTTLWKLSEEMCVKLVEENKNNILHLCILPPSRLYLREQKWIVLDLRGFALAKYYKYVIISKHIAYELT